MKLCSSLAELQCARLKLLRAASFHGRTDMRRREFITALGGMTVAWPVVTRAQQPAKKIGFLSVSSPGLHTPFVAAFNAGLKEVSKARIWQLNTPGRKAILIDFPHWLCFGME
jgi:hypothetical protein